MRRSTEVWLCPAHLGHAPYDLWLWYHVPLTLAGEHLANLLPPLPTPSPHSNMGNSGYTVSSVILGETLTLLAPQFCQLYNQAGHFVFLGGLY